MYNSIKSLSLWRKIKARFSHVPSIRLHYGLWNNLYVDLKECLQTKLKHIITPTKKTQALQPTVAFEIYSVHGPSDVRRFFFLARPPARHTLGPDSRTGLRNPGWTGRAEA